jgi:hypothetical protein
MFLCEEILRWRAPCWEGRAAGISSRCSPELLRLALRSPLRLDGLRACRDVVLPQWALFAGGGVDNLAEVVGIGHAGFVPAAEFEA